MLGRFLSRPPNIPQFARKDGDGPLIAPPGRSRGPDAGVARFHFTGRRRVRKTLSARSKIGTAPLPPPVQVTPAAVNQTAACTPSNYEGMRVTVSGGPFKANGTDASGTCPSPLAYTTASGG